MNRLAALRALEALRNGVPNADAVRAVGCMQPAAQAEFADRLERLVAGRGGADPTFVEGQLIAGSFGAGKSHTLSYFAQEALARNCVASHVVVSKETPLHDPSKLFQAALRVARLPRARGAFFRELKVADYFSPALAGFWSWAVETQSHGLLAASVLIDKLSQNPDIKNQVRDWWSGEKLAISSVRTELKRLDAPENAEVRAIKAAELAPLRFEFAARYARAAGCGGWVVLLDELEQISQYSLLQRAKSYAELARLMGAVAGMRIPGLLVIGAISNDYAVHVLRERNDLEKAPERLQAKGDQASLAHAMMSTMGMELLCANGVLELSPPSDDTLALSFEKLRQLYGTAYGFVPSQTFSRRLSLLHSMRLHVRQWISDWDLLRLYGNTGEELVVEERNYDYSSEDEPEVL